MKLDAEQKAEILTKLNEFMSKISGEYGINANTAIDILANYNALLLHVAREQGAIKEEISNDIVVEAVKRTILGYLDQLGIAAGKFVHSPVDRLH